MIKWYYPEGIDWIYTKKTLLNLYKIIEEILLLACVSLIYFPTFS